MFWNPGQNIAQFVIERDDRFTLMPTFPGGQDNCVIADVRPRKADQVTKAQSGIGGQINGIC